MLADLRARHNNGGSFFIGVKNGDHHIKDRVTQRIGLAQGDTASAFLYVVDASSLADRLRRAGATFAFFADDLAILAEHQAHLQRQWRVQGGGTQNFKKIDGNYWGNC